MRSLRKFSALLLLAALAAAFAACGQPPPSQSEETAKTAAETTGEPTAETTGGETTGTEEGTSEFRGVVESYQVAQQEIEAEGGEKEAGEYRVGYIVEPAEGWWEGEPGNLQWRAPLPGETNHIEILPFDAETGLLVPEAGITLTILDENGDKVGSKPLELYYAEFYHYANNFGLPGSGEYTLRAEITPPEFRRHGEESGEGKVYTEPVTVEFENVQIDTEE